MTEFERALAKVLVSEGYPRFLVLPFAISLA